MRPRAAAALLCALCCALAKGSEDIVVGCGGFVKSDVEINYSLIEVGAAAPPAPAACRACRALPPGPRSQVAVELRLFSTLALLSLLAINHVLLPPGTAAAV